MIDIYYNLYIIFIDLDTLPKFSREKNTTFLNLFIFMNSVKNIHL